MAGLQALLAAIVGTVVMAVAVLAGEERARRQLDQRSPSSRARWIASFLEETSSFR